MTYRQKQIVRDNFDAVRDVAGPLARLFYGRLFELQPELRGMFHTDVNRQGAKLMEMLSAVVDNLDQLETLTPTLQAMGQRHAGYGVTAQHYATVERALLWSLGHALGNGLDAEQRDAWRLVMARISEAMQDGARNAK